MRKTISTVFINFIVWASVFSQNTNDTLRIMQITPNMVKIDNIVRKQYDYFNPSNRIEWLQEKASMVVKVQTDIRYKDNDGNEQVLFKGVTRKIRANDIGAETNLLWWLKCNGTITKGAVVDKTYDMYEDELIIEINQVLKEGQSYEFKSQNGKSFNCESDNEKPLIRITKEMLASIGFNGEPNKSIKLGVIFHNCYDTTDCERTITINYKK